MGIYRVDLSLLKVDEDLVTFYEDEPFTGVASANWPNGQLGYERFFRAGIPHGWSREWSEDGRLLEEGLLIEGALRQRRQYHENGVMSSELFQSGLGIVYRRRGWDDMGQLVEDFTLEGYENCNWIASEDDRL